MAISIDAGKCTGCKSCELICSLNKTGAFNPHKARIKVVNLDYLGFSNPVTCLQCKKPACAEACPPGALGKDEKGVMHLDEARCSGCRLCVDACIVGAINFDEEKGQPLICNLCDGKPGCVAWCPSGALKLNSTRRIGKKEMAYTIAKAQPYMTKWKIPDSALDWYRKFST